MKKENADTLRKTYTAALIKYFEEAGEDVGRIASGTLNFPVAVNGEEGWIEVCIKIPKDDLGYENREDYAVKLAKAEARAKEKEKKAKEKDAE